MEKEIYLKGKTMWISDDLDYIPLGKNYNQDIKIGARVLYGSENHKLEYNRITGVLKITKNIAESKQDLQDLEQAIKDNPENNTTLKILSGGFQLPLGNISEIVYLD